AGLASVAFVAFKGNGLLRSPWLDLVVSCAPVWVATAALLFVRSGPEGTAAFSLEAAFLWGLVFACGGAAALERGRGEGSGVQLLASTDRRMPRPVGMVWEHKPEGGGSVFATPLPAGDRLYIATLQTAGFT